MAGMSTKVLIQLSLAGADASELDELTRQLRSEIRDLPIDAIEQVSEGVAPNGVKGLDIVAIGQMAVTLGPTIVPPLLNLLTSWVNRKPTTPVKITLKCGKRTAVIAYDPTKTSSKDLDTLVKTLNKSLKV